jgi:CDP-diacylglycerol--serine O-phosphatidyltransferase
MKRPRLVAIFPTMLTLGNAVCGFACITMAAKVGPESAEGNHLLYASLFIYLGMLFDALDGSAARLTNQTSEFGAELDSLCDAVSFGVAPAFLMLQFSREYHGRLLWVIGVVFALCALLRLARFNIETDDDDSHDAFSGLPSPAAAGVVASFPIALRGLNNLSEDVSIAPIINDYVIPAMKMSLPFFTLAVAILMVSRIPYPHVFNQLMQRRHRRWEVIQIMFTLAVVFLVRELALPLIFVFFAFAAPVKAAWKELVSGRLYKSKSV